MEILKGKKEELEKKAVDLIVARMAELGQVMLGLVGGNSVAEVYARLFESDVDWSKVHIFMVDERCLPVTSEDSNFRGIYEGFLRKLIADGRLPESNVHPFHFDEIHEESCVTKYNEEFEYVCESNMMNAKIKNQNGLSELQNKAKGLPGQTLHEVENASYHSFDIVILSAGEDGHIGSLFPGHASVKDESDGYIAVSEAPKAPSKRISASRKMLEKSDMGILLFFGESKKQAFENFQDDNLSIIDCPAKIVTQVEKSYIFAGW